MDFSLSKQKRIALITDFTGFGRCSAAVTLPIVSVMGVECAVAPTAILSAHTGFTDVFFDDYRAKLSAFLSKWNDMNIPFDAVYTGYLACEQNAEAVEDFLKRLERKPLLVVDPVMADNGKCYSFVTDTLCDRMKKLVGLADVITPNITEACILTDTPYHEDWTDDEVNVLLEKLVALGPSKVVITGIFDGTDFSNYGYDEQNGFFKISNKKTGDARPGTGDVFASVLAGKLVSGENFFNAICRASEFVAKCIKKSDELGVPAKEGVCFEILLKDL